MRYAFFAVGQTRERVRRWPGAKSSGTRGPAAFFFNPHRVCVESVERARCAVDAGAHAVSVDERRAGWTGGLEGDSVVKLGICGFLGDLRFYRFIYLSFCPIFTLAVNTALVLGNLFVVLRGRDPPNPLWPTSV